MGRKLELLVDINEVMEAIDEEIDAFIGTFKEPTDLGKRIAKTVFEYKKEKTLNLSKKMSKKWQTK